MEKQEIKKQLANILSTVFEKEISEDDNFSMGVNSEWTSIKHIELIVMIEEEFEVAMPIDKIPELNSQEKLLEELTELLK